MAKKLKLKSVKKIKESIQEEKKKKPKKSKEKKKKKVHFGTIFLMLFITGGIFLASLIIAFSLYIVFTSPEFDKNKLYQQEASIIRWNDGSIMARLGDENRVLKNYEDFPQTLIDALIATEDSRFFQHSGLDAARFIKASIGQLLGHSDAGGASTLSMQLSKNKISSTEDSGIKGIIRKFTDVYISVFKIEKNYTKEQIIEMYLNAWWFANGDSNSGGIFGVEQASQYYFGKSVSDLTLPESALIIGMINNSSLYHPYNYPDLANERKNVVLNLMYKHGYITEQEMKDAQSIHVSSLVVPQENNSVTSPYQALIDHVQREIILNEGIDIAKTPGYDVTTTFDKNIQEIVNSVEAGATGGFKDELVQYGIAVTSVENGSIVALSPGRNFTKTGKNRGTGYAGYSGDLMDGNYVYEYRQPGSTAKPLVDYGPLIEYNNATTGQMFIDFRYPYNNGSYINNWNNTFNGPMILKDALSSSRNITALQAFHQNDRNNIKQFLANLGITEENYQNNGEVYEAMSIGGFTAGLTPLLSSAAYAAFARGGYYIKPYSYTKILNTTTEETIEYKYERTRAMSEETAYMITDVLLQATREGTAGSVNYGIRGSIASKSGTSNIDGATASAKGVSVYATPDHWVNTYNGDYSISTWMGYDYQDLDANHYFTSATGTPARQKISSYLANNILTSNHGFTKPSTVTSVTIERNILPPKRASEYTPDNMKYSAYFKAGTEPSSTSYRFQKLDDPSNGKATVTNKKISLSWDNASTPKALDTTTVRNELANFMSYYRTNYSLSYQLFEQEYMRIYESYNASSIGSFGYQVYLKDANGNMKDLGWTLNNHFTYDVKDGGDYEFVIKSSYSIFKTNQSSGISIKITVPKDKTEYLKGTARNVCVEKNGTFNPKTGVTVTYENEDVTAKAIITANSIDTSTTGEKNVTYVITYNDETIKVNGKVSVSDQCENSQT